MQMSMSHPYDAPKKMNMTFRLEMPFQIPMKSQPFIAGFPISQRSSRDKAQTQKNDLSKDDETHLASAGDPGDPFFVDMVKLNGV